MKKNDLGLVHIYCGEGKQYDILADGLRQALDMDLIYSLIK